MDIRASDDDEPGGSLKDKEKSFQDIVAIKKFSGLACFDDLVKIRGLKLVTFALNHESGFDNYRMKNFFERNFHSKPSEGEIKTFENFLMSQLTKPRPEKVRIFSSVPKLEPSANNTPGCQEERQKVCQKDQEQGRYRRERGQQRGRGRWRRP
jgi:hypothetical protein